MLLADKVALITGGAGLNGLGYATARMMAAHGARVVILDLERASPAAAAAQLGPQHLGVVADVTDKASCERGVAQVLAQCGRIDILVNNAGITQPRKFARHQRADYDAVLDVSLRGTLYMSQAVLPTMREQQSGRLDRLHLVGVGAARRRHPGRPALLGRQGRRAGPGARAWRASTGIDNVRVNCVTPGLIATDINKGLIPDGQACRASSSGIPLNRIGEPERRGRLRGVPGQRPGQVLHRRDARRQRRHADPLSPPPTKARTHTTHKTTETTPCNAEPSPRR